MSPELEKSIKERIIAGIGFEQIEAELIAAGYSKEVAESAIKQAAMPEAPAPHFARVFSTGTELMKAGFAIAKNRLDIVLLLGLSSAATNVVAIQSEYSADLPELGLLVAVGVGALIVYIFSIFAAYYIVAKAPTTKVSIQDGLSWAMRNTIPVFWISLLSFFVISSGFLLLIIPGFILGILIYFALYAFIHDEKRGLQALLRSRAVVLDRKMLVFKRLTVIFLYSFVLSLLFSIPFGIIELLELDSLMVTILLESIIQIAISFVTVIVIAASNILYLELAEDRPVTEPEKNVVMKYRVLSIFGPIALIGVLVILVGMLGALWWGLIDTPVPNNNGSDAVRSQVMFTEPIAELYFLEQTTYTGVCDVVMPAVTMADSIECFSTESEWALAAQTGNEYWCTDVTGYGKVIPGPLNGRTSCLNLPTSEGDTEVMNVPEAETASGTPEIGEILPMM